MGKGMSLMCALGLAACLSYNGHRFTAEEAAGISDECFELAHAPPSSFATPPPARSDLPMRDQVEVLMSRYKGYATAHWLQNAGLELDWNVAPAQRRSSWLRSCNSFNRAFKDNSKWTHLEKWPWGVRN